MTNQTQTKLEGKLNLNFPEVNTSLVQGEDALNIYNSLGDYITNLAGISYNSKTYTITGSNLFLSARIDTLVKPLGYRVANLRDLSRQEVKNVIKEKHYSDTPVLVLRSMEDSYEKNIPLIKRIAKEVEEANGKLEFPVMVSGFDVKHWPEDEDGYGIDIVPRDDFKAVYDERLEGKHSGKKFSEVDDFGLPNFDKDGDITWYTKDNGLSRLFLNGDLDLDSDNDDLADSNSNGRVVLVSAQGASEFFLGNCQSKLGKRREELET